MRWFKNVTLVLLVFVVGIILLPFQAKAAAPKQILIGTLYASSGPFATSSTSQYHGLEFWANQVNKQGGVYVAAFKKKIPVKLIAYDDQSSTTLAATLYNQLITRDKVNLLVADFGSVLTSVAVPIAQEHKILLFDPTGTSAKFFSPKNPYLVLTSLPTSGVWPTVLADFLITHKINKVAVIYSANDFNQSQAETLKAKLEAAKIKPVYYHAVPTDTSNYTVLIRTIQATHPEALIEFGYPPNDIAFLQNLQASGAKFNMVFTIFPGQQLALIEKNVGTKALEYTYTYPTPPLLVYNKVNYGMPMSEFEKIYTQETKRPVDFLTVAGYNAGLIVEKTLSTSKEFNQLAFRNAINSFSGKIFTLNGLFKINNEGAQIGEFLPVGQFQPTKTGLALHVVYPMNIATGKPIYPAP
jgi:branched-chain amino acid transport system substrate-binding protein